MPTRNAHQWIRPPYACVELDFLIKCTRCGDCIEACPHNVLFPLPAKFGLQAAATPAMDLVNKGCHLCADWPCVEACQDDALALPTARDDEEKKSDALQPPRLAIATIDKDKCLPYLGPECGACADSCPVPGALTWDGPRPNIDANICAGCAMCREVCVVDPKAVIVGTLPASSKN